MRGNMQKICVLSSMGIIRRINGILCLVVQRHKVEALINSTNSWLKSIENKTILDAIEALDLHAKIVALKTYQNFKRFIYHQLIEPLESMSKNFEVNTKIKTYKSLIKCVEFYLEQKNKLLIMMKRLNKVKESRNIMKMCTHNHIKSMDDRSGCTRRPDTFEASRDKICESGLRRDSRHKGIPMKGIKILISEIDDDEYQKEESNLDQGSLNVDSCEAFSAIPQKMSESKQFRSHFESQERFKNRLHLFSPIFRKDKIDGLKGTKVCLNKPKKRKFNNCSMINTPDLTYISSNRSPSYGRSGITRYKHKENNKSNDQNLSCNATVAQRNISKTPYSKFEKKFTFKSVPRHINTPATSSPNTVKHKANIKAIVSFIKTKKKKSNQHPQTTVDSNKH